MAIRRAFDMIYCVIKQFSYDDSIPINFNNNISTKMYFNV